MIDMNCILIASIVPIQVTSKTAKFVWEIKEISNIVKQKLWTVPKCKFSIGPYKWKLSLSLRDKENILYAKPELITPTDAEASYSLYLSVVNAQNYVLHSPQFREYFMRSCTLFTNYQTELIIFFLQFRIIPYFTTMVARIP